SRRLADAGWQSWFAGSHYRTLSSSNDPPLRDPTGLPSPYCHTRVATNGTPCGAHMGGSAMSTGILRKSFVEFLGTFILVFFAVGVAALSFGHGFGFAGISPSAGVVATALTFGLVLLALVYVLGPISGCHVNPAVTMGFLVGRRITLADAVAYWIARCVGGVAGGAGLFGAF